MKQLRLVASVLKIVSRERSLNRMGSLVEISNILARYVVLLFLYAYIFKYKGGSINGTTFQVITWSMFFYFTIMMFKIRDIGKHIMSDIKSGSVEILFSKPFHYLWYRIIWQLSSGFFPFISVALLGSTILYFSVGIPATMHSMFFVLTFLVAFVFSIINAVCIYTMVGLMAFWYEDIESTRWIIDKFVMILGGSYLPVALFPKVLYLLAIWSPFGAAYFVTHTVNDSWRSNFGTLLSIQFFWVVVLVFLMIFMFSRAQKKLSVNGG
jgi:ABC-2 type transport system permease protein